MDVNVNKAVSGKFLNPIECFGAEEGRIFQQYFKGEPLNEYLIGVGKCERPMTIWWNEDDMDVEGTHKYRLSSESKKDLKGFTNNTKYLEVTGTIEVNLNLG